VACESEKTIFSNQRKEKVVAFVTWKKGIVQLQQGKMATKGINVVVFLSSVRPNRIADRICKHFLEAISAKGMTPVLMGSTRTFLMNVLINYLINFKLIRNFQIRWNWDSWSSSYRFISCRTLNKHRTGWKYSGQENQERWRISDCLGRVQWRLASGPHKHARPLSTGFVQQSSRRNMHIFAR